jgi:hypothetical protein
MGGRLPVTTSVGSHRSSLLVPSPGVPLDGEHLAGIGIIESA